MTNLPKAWPAEWRPTTGYTCPTPSIRAAQPSGSGGSDWLADEVNGRERHAEHIAERAAIGEAMLAEVRPGDRILIMGARDDTLIDFANGLVERLAETHPA